MTPKAEPVTYKPHQIVYAASARCKCGRGLAYPRDTSPRGAWYCEMFLLEAPEVECLEKPDGMVNPGLFKDKQGVTHNGPHPFMFWSIVSEDSPRAVGKTTRPVPLTVEELILAKQFQNVEREELVRARNVQLLPLLRELIECDEVARQEQIHAQIRSILG